MCKIIKEERYIYEKRKKCFFCSTLLVIFMVSILFTGTTVKAVTANPEDNINLVVLFNDNTIDTKVEDFIIESGGKIVSNLSKVGGLEVKCKSALIPKIQAYDTVKSLAPNHNIKLPKEKTIEFKNYGKRKITANSANNNQPGDLYNLYQWDIKKVTNDGKSFEICTGNHDVVIAIVDSGIKKDHPDLEKNFMGGKNFVSKDFNGDETETGDVDDINDRLGHGTYVAGNIAANGRTKGVAPNIGFKSYRIFNSKGDTNATIVSSAIIEATDDGAKVINLSMSGYDLKGKCYWTDPKTGIKHSLGDDMAEYELYKRAIKYAIKHNVTVVTAAGNDGVDCHNAKKITEFLNTQNGDEGFKYEGLAYEIPGNIKGVINVSATGTTDEIAKYSNYGDKFIDVTAPGGDSSKTGTINDMCLSTAINDSGYMFGEGTSIAAPKVSAIVGLLLCENHSFTPKEIVKIIYKTSEKLDDNKSKEYYGAGLANAYEALAKYK
ncbi:S8 family serine peptidase [Clostridium estertheticum]|uniref:S8 family peptidase n=1 Tax=Clostridium estertheticum TaxID=238834 RepID=UPI001C0AC38B|nr:S8 family serine peptidase [Clostridium estertheticum]MBU3178100.1 S8 family serine peptidase [Clostridium estertheticum]